jgi:phosphate transport system substrate-binding protein
MHYPIIAVLLTFFAAEYAIAQVPLDHAHKEYQRSDAGVSGAIKAIGSDTMGNLMSLWAEGFLAFYPAVKVSIEAKGSSTGPSGLIEGQSNIAPMSRAMKADEIDAFERKFGYKPTQLRAGIDMLAIYVHRDNPIAKQGLTLQQVDAIFSRTRKGGETRDVATWGDLGLDGDWADKPISLYGRNSASGTYGYFKQHALFGGDFKDSVKEQPGSSAVISGIAKDRYGIGYSGIGYRTADVLVVPLALSADEQPVAPTTELVDEYPLTRFLYIYVNRKPGEVLDPLRREFLRYIYSKQGQQLVIQDGYLALSAAIAQQELTQIGIE